MIATAPHAIKHSYYEANARNRILGLLDTDTFRELLPPQERTVSPHLETLDVPWSFDDGVIVGTGKLEGKSILIAAQEGGFMGGAVGEVHGAKITGLLERAVQTQVDGVLLLIESGGVRLHEANAGLIAVSEIIRALLTVREAGIPIIALIGGTYGCFGGMGIVARCCDTVIMSEEGRLGLSGPEVIETVMGVEEFDSRDRALVWRTVGGKHRYIIGEAQVLVDDDRDAFRNAASAALNKPQAPTLEALEAEHAMLEERITEFGECPDALDIWRKLGLANPERLPLLEAAEFLKVAAQRRAG